MAQVISVISGKGGTGKSTVSGGIAVSLASGGINVLLVDMDIGLRALDIMLGLENAVVYDIGDVLARRCTVEKAVAAHKVYPSLRLLCAPTNIGVEFDITQLIEVINKCQNNYDYVILDLPAGLGLSVLLAKALSDIVLVVATTDAVTLRDSRKICDAISRDCKAELKLIVNRVSKSSLKTGNIKDLDEVMDTIGIPLVGVLKEDKWIKSVLNNDGGIKKVSADTKKALKAISCRLDGKYMPLVVKSC